MQQTIHTMVKELDPKSSVPLHIQAENLLRELISSGAYKNGKLLPKEVDLAKKLKISRNTLRHAIDRLVTDGLLLRKKGVGTTVNTLGAASSYAKNWLSFSQEMQSMGLSIRNYELHICWEPASLGVADFFHIKEGTPVLQMSRVRGTLTSPMVYFYSYFNPAIGMSGDEDFAQPLYTMLHDSYGITVHRSIEEISAQLADKALAEMLWTDVGSPILCRKRMVLDTADVPIEYNIGLYRADMFSYKLESER